MQEILDKLAECGINAERKSIYDDLDALRDFGLDVKYKKRKTGRLLHCRTDCCREKNETVPKPESRPNQKRREGRTGY